jgi:FtsH-binding integral membrane protein
MALYGYTTKRDLTAWGSFLFMGLLGLIVASLVGLFVQSTALQFAISVIGVLIFTGLTAYDARRSRKCTMAATTARPVGKKAVMGAL